MLTHSQWQVQPSMQRNPKHLAILIRTQPFYKYNNISELYKFTQLLIIGKHKIKILHILHQFRQVQSQNIIIKQKGYYIYIYICIYVMYIQHYFFDESQLQIIQNHIQIDNQKQQMNSASKLPYRIQFQPQYQQIHQRMAKLPIPSTTNSDGVYQVSDELLQLVNNVKDKIRDQDLQYTASKIYSNYASPNDLKEGKKNASDTCPGCGEQSKKQVQCQFCAIVYCKNCCWRTRVIPNLSQPKDSRKQCEDCHLKFIKLFVDQNFHSQSAILQKIIDTSNLKLKKIQKQVKTKKQKTQASDKKKKQMKIRQNMLLKQLKDEEKKVQQLQSKLQDVVKVKAEQLRQKQEQQQKQKQQAQENEKKQNERKLQLQIQQTLRRQKQLQAQQQVIKKKQQQTQNEIKNQRIQAELEKQKQKQNQQHIQEQRKKQEQQKMKRMLSEQQHKKETNQLVTLAHQMSEHSNSEIVFTQTITNAPPVLTSVDVAQHVELKHTEQPEPVQVKSYMQEIISQKQITPVKSDISSTPNKNDKSQSLIINTPQISVKNSYEEPKVNSSIDLKSNQNFVITSLNFANNNNSNNKIETNEKIQETQGTEKGTQNHQQIDTLGKDKAKLIKQQKNINQFQALPLLAMKVSEMTINQLLGFHINPNVDQNARRSQRESIKQQRRQSRIIQSALPPTVTVSQNQAKAQQVKQKQLSAQEREQILRSSNISRSLLHSNHNQEEQQAYQHNLQPQKCTCSIM